MPKTSTTVLFPGQGAYYGRALADLREGFPEVAPVLAGIADAARPLLGDAAVAPLLAPRTPEPDQWLREAPEALQLALYTVSVATYGVLRARGLRPDVLVGHSLGEIAALVAAGAFTPAEGARIVCHRSLALREAGLGDAYMAALGTGPERARQLLDVVGDPLTGVAAENHAAQTVLSGRAETLDTVRQLASVLRIDFARLKSPYAFHSPLLGPAAEKFAARIRDIRQGPLHTPVHSPILGRRYEDADDLPGLLAGHLTRPVRFAEAVRAVCADGAGAEAAVFVESGALDALCRIVARVAPAGPPTRVLTLPTLLPEAGGAAALRQALDRLAAEGAIPAAQAAAGDPLHGALLAEVPAAEFAAFWAGRGGEVREFVRRAYADHTAAAPVAAPPAAPAASTVAAPAATPAAMPPAPPPSAPERDRGALVRELAGVYAQALEYPAEVFEEGTDLEAELGVDSVKQTELLVRVGDRYGLPPRPSDVRPAAYNTLGKIADLILATA